MYPHHHKMGRMVAVPNGFVRYNVLRLLNEKPMSGSEIMSELEKDTRGWWRPSPGSIYPLLSWLQDKGYVKEAHDQGDGTRRYVLTDGGKSLLEEQTKMREEMKERYRHFGRHLGPPYGFMGRMESGPHSKEAGELWSAARSLATAFMGLRHRLREEPSEEAAKEAKEALEEATRKLEEIAKK